MTKENDQSKHQLHNMNISRRQAGAMLLGAVAFAACSPKVSTRPQVTATGGQINLGVSSLDIITDYVGPNKPPYIDHLIIPSPAMQLSQWASKTIYPADQDGNALLTIINASMTETEIEAEDGLTTLFTNQQRLLIFVEFEAVLSMSHPDGRQSATLSLASSAEKSIPDNVSPEEADQIRFDAIRDAVGLFDQELRAQLQGFNGNWPLYNG